MRFIEKLNSYPHNVNNFNPPISMSNIKLFEEKFGILPASTREMLTFFNGAELFIDAIPMVSLFGISSEESKLMDFFDISHQTHKWRDSTKSSGSWVIGITNYGGLYVVVDDDKIREWDTSQCRWNEITKTYNELIDGILEEGIEYMMV